MTPSVAPFLNGLLLSATFCAMGFGQGMLRSAGSRHGVF